MESIVEAGFDDDLWFFSPELTPVAGDPLVAPRLSPELLSELLVEELHSHLAFTVELELGIVARGCRRLVESDLLPLSPEHRHAVEVVLDEERNHGAWAAELAERVAAATGIAPPTARAEQLVAIESIIEAQPLHLRELVEVAALFISETTITGVLRILPGDQRVQPAVRDFARAHAQEERRHHVLFRSLFLSTWATTDRSMHPVLGPLLLEILWTFLSVDARRLRAAQDRARRELGTVAPSAHVLASMQRAAQPTLRMFEMAGVFDNDVTSDALRDSGLSRCSPLGFAQPA